VGAATVAALAGGMTAGTIGAAQATTTTSALATSTVDEAEWYASSTAEPPVTKCKINASSLAYIDTADAEEPGQPPTKFLALDLNADIHNPYLFVGCTIGVSVDVVDTGGVTMKTVYREAFAGAWFDPQGNNKSYTWHTSASLTAPQRNRIHHLRIRFSNVG
jgi:hypothetical protein